MYFIVILVQRILLYTSRFTLVCRVFTNGPGDLGSIPPRHTKASKMVLDASLLNTQHYIVGIKGKWNNPKKWVVLSHRPPCSINWKGSLHVTLNNGHLLNFTKNHLTTSQKRKKKSKEIWRDINNTWFV